MKRVEQQRKIRGAYCAVYTPATPDAFEVDYTKLREQLRFIMEGGVHGDRGVIMLAGGAGEGYFLTDEQWSKSIKILAEECHGKIATMAGVFDRGSKGAIEKIKYAESLGIDLIQLGLPHNQGPADQEIHTFFSLIDRATSRIGIILYHTHWDFSSYDPHYQIGMALLEKLTELDSVVGVKWHTKSVELFVDALLKFGDKVSFVDNAGWVTRTKANPFGIKAFMAPPANWDPKRTIEAINLWSASKWKEFAEFNSVLAAPKAAVIRASQEELYGGPTPARWENGAANRLVYSLGEGTVNKAIMDVMGRPIGPALHPQYQLSEATKQRAREYLREGKNLVETTF